MVTATQIVQRTCFFMTFIFFTPARQNLDGSQADFFWHLEVKILAVWRLTPSRPALQKAKAWIKFDKVYSLWQSWSLFHVGFAVKVIYADPGVTFVGQCSLLPRLHTHQNFCNFSKVKAIEESGKERTKHVTKENL